MTTENKNTSTLGFFGSRKDSDSSTTDSKKTEGKKNHPVGLFVMSHFFIPSYLPRQTAGLAKDELWKTGFPKQIEIEGLAHRNYFYQRQLYIDHNTFDKGQSDQFDKICDSAKLMGSGVTPKDVLNGYFISSLVVVPMDKIFSPKEREYAIAITREQLENEKDILVLYTWTDQGSNFFDDTEIPEQPKHMFYNSNDNIRLFIDSLLDKFKTDNPEELCYQLISSGPFNSLNDLMELYKDYRDEYDVESTALEKLYANYFKNRVKEIEDATSLPPELTAITAKYEESEFDFSTTSTSPK